MQLAWAQQVAYFTSRPVLILTPLAVSYQTAEEAKKFGIPAGICEEQGDCLTSVCITNYQKLHKFDPSQFAGVVLDESSILKSFTGATTRQLIETFSRTPYRLCCTATPAPNDHLELGNHADFLGIMPQKEMLARWFVNDLMGNMSWRLKGHARQDFWRWVASWAVSLRSPQDIGESAEGYDLPELTIHHVRPDMSVVCVDGQLFADAALSATNLHTVLRATATVRANKAAELVNQHPGDSWLLWTHTNYEADAVHTTGLDVHEVRGSDPDAHKEDALIGFASARISRLMSKPSICGFGMNFQCCHRMIFVGMNYSYEQFYQAVRRCWRFGQQHPVQVYVLATEHEWTLLDTLAAKQQAHRQMQDEMIAIAREEFANV